MGWPMDWAACMDFYASLSRVQIREQFKAFCDARPAGSKFAHRTTDLPAGASPSMKWVNPPVAYMLHAGLPRLRAAGVHLPGLESLQPRALRVGLEAYPGRTICLCWCNPPSAVGVWACAWYWACVWVWWVIRPP